MIAPGVARILIVTASRECTDRSLFRGALTAIYYMRPGTAVYVGDAVGGDMLARDIWAALCGYGRWQEAVDGGWLRRFTASWDDPCQPGCQPGCRKARSDGSDYCPMAGPYRNQDMCDEAGETGLPVGLLAVTKNGALNRGTRGCTAIARKAFRGLYPNISLTEDRRPR